MAVAQAAAGAVASYDTLSLTLSTLAGTIALALTVRGRHAGWVMLLFAVALLCKESAVGFFPILLVCALLPYPGIGPHAARASQRGFVLGLVVITAAYVVWRTHLGGFLPKLAPGRYNAGIGPGTVRNLVMLWFVAFLPVSSVAVFTAFAVHHTGVVMAGVISAAVVVLLCLAGYVSGRHMARVLAWMAAATVMIVPVIPLNHVSELYAYALVPCVALLFGQSVSHLLRGGRSARVATLVVVVAVLGANAWAAHGKAVAITQNGERSQRLLNDMIKEMSSLPRGATLALVDPATALSDYSIFRVRGFWLVPDETLKQRTGRDDVTLVRLRAGDALPSSPRLVAVTLDGDGRLRPFAP
ncbi:MAG TPA: hypothetical protein VFH88_10830 [Candidatus Krumholzibacteria bacterium]|nr:hypothetical protein [Candidatus Krumholzibacteria bacterium]